MCSTIYTNLSLLIGQFVGDVDPAVIKKIIVAAVFFTSGIISALV